MAHAPVGGASVSERASVPEVEVLLATYNGERFLREQIDSILAQDYAGLRVLARDDGSEDGTRAILEEYSRSDEARFRVLPQSTPTGSAKGNFVRLMDAATAEFVCFADQDDVWLQGKVRRTMDAMLRLRGRHGAETPLLVFTDLRVVDERLRAIAESMWEQAGIEPESIHRLERLLGQNVATGCTVMINRRMNELGRRMPREALMHDRWLGLLAAAMGAADFLSERTVLYRQHGANVIGAAAQDDSLNGRAVRARDSRGRRLERWRSEEQAEALIREHGAEMGEGTRALLEAYLRSGRSESRLERVATTLRYRFFRTGSLRNAAMIADLWRSRTSEGFRMDDTTD